MIEQILKDSAYKLAQFSKSEIAAVEEKIYQKPNGKNYMKCLIRDKEIQLKPEEVIRQLFIYKLLNFYGYQKSQIEIEHAVHFGREVKRADIVIMEKDRPDVEYIIIEVKRPKLKDGKAQLRSYCNATGATMGVWTNGNSISFYHRKNPNYFEDISDIPRADQKLKDILHERWTIQELAEKDKLVAENKSLKDLILEMEDEVLANSGNDVFEEVFKLIFTKLYDEFMSGKYRSRTLEFRNYGDTDADLKETIQNLFDGAKKQWEGVFTKSDKIKLTPSHLAICVSSLQDIKLFNSDLEIIDEAFEYLMNKSQKGEKGQYFTPRYVIEMCVRMLNPQKNETMIDTAAGSCGFTVHTMFYVWKKILREGRISQNQADASTECKDYVKNNVFAIDFDEKAVRVARTLNLIAGDGNTNVLWLNTLDYDRWNEYTNSQDWTDIYNDAWKKLRGLRAVEGGNQNFNFDILMANPPFAGDIKESRILHKYEIAKKFGDKYQTKMGRDILFIERNLQFLKPGGRMAIVVPQGRLNNFSDKYIRDFIAERCRILAVIGLHGNVFKPHTGTKTGVIFLQKWDDKFCPRRDDYPIFFATMKKPSKNNSGEKIYKAIDDKNHWIVDHDLFNYEGLTQDGIAEAFIEFARKEKLSFFDPSSFNELHYQNLLKERDCTEILLSKLFEDNATRRIDAEFFSRAAVATDNFIKSKKHFYFAESEVVSGPFGSSLKSDSYLATGDIAFVRIENIRADFQIDTSNLVYISAQSNRRLLSSQLFTDDIILSKVGKIGLCARVDSQIATCNISENNIGIKLKNFCTEEKHFILAYLNSKFGQILILRRQSGNVQQKLNVGDICQIPIPKFNCGFYELISALILKSDACIKSANENYRAAEKILATELRLDTFTPRTENFSIKNFSQSFLKNGRIDAEYYQPKYDDIRNFMNVAGTVESLCTLHDENFFSDSEKIYKYIELADIGTNGNISTPDKIIGKELPSRARQIVKAGQVIISSIEGSLQSCAFITSENNGAICSTGFFVIDSKYYTPATLLVLFKSKLMQELLKQGCSGTILTAISRENFLNLPLPIIDAAAQAKISETIDKSFELRAESEKSLKIAKTAVEMAIEHGETAAIEKLRAGEEIGD